MAIAAVLNAMANRKITWISPRRNESPLRGALATVIVAGVLMLVLTAAFYAPS